jgi:hypothetical protein
MVIQVVQGYPRVNQFEGSFPCALRGRKWVLLALTRNKFTSLHSLSLSFLRLILLLLSFHLQVLPCLSSSPRKAQHISISLCNVARPVHFIPLKLITLKISEEELVYRICSSPLNNFLHPPLHRFFSSPVPIKLLTSLRNNRKEQFVPQSPWTVTF